MSNHDRAMNCSPCNRESGIGLPEGISRRRCRAVLDDVTLWLSGPIGGIAGGSAPFGASRFPEASPSDGRPELHFYDGGGLRRTCAAQVLSMGNVTCRVSGRVLEESVDSSDRRTLGALCFVAH